MKTMNVFIFFFWITCLCWTISCQTSPQVAFDNVAIGTEKSKVLVAIGSPERSYRKNGLDYWVYKMQSKSGTWMYKELVFKDGIVIKKEIPEQSAKPKASDYEAL